MLTVVMVVLVCVVHKTLGAASWIDGKQNITVYYRINGDTLFDWGYNSDETIDFIRWWFEPTGASSPSVIMAITSGETSPTVVDDAYKTRLKWDNSTPAAMTLIKTQTKDIEGVYSVTVSLSVTRKLPDGYTVDFQEIPTFTSWPEIVTSYRGQSATLTWTLSKPLSTKWYSIVLIYEKQTPITICTWQGFNPNKIYYGSGYNAERVRADIKTGSKIVSYTLYNLQSDDVRYNYKCQVRTIPQAAVSNTEAWILLYEIPSSPVINRSPSNAVVNRVLTLTCSARSTSILPNNLPTYLHPTMEYRWQRDKSNISNDGRHTVNGNVLTIDKVQRQDHHTTYRCIAQETGSRLSDYKDLTLNVMYGPYDIKATPSGNITQTENDSLTLTCAATCNPNCSYKWTKDGQQISNSDKLYFGNIKRQEQGTYRCLASNDIGTDQHAGVCIQVYYPPELHTTVTPSGDLIQGSEVTLMCTVDSRPVPSSLTWTNITLSDMTVFDNNKHNNTHCWLTLSDINILHSGNYQCRADNGVRGSPVTVNISITVHGPPRWYKLDPVDKVIGASVGDRVNFKVWVITQPLPRQDEWQWKFSPTNSSNIINREPEQVDLTVSGDMALLSITSVTINHYGNYYIWTKNKYGGWNEEDLSFSLKPQGPPLKPCNFLVTDVTAVSIRVEWITGFNGGLPQTFTIKYTNVATGVVLIKSDIEDIGAGSGQIMTDDITDGIEPETKYKLEIFAVNSQGQIAGDIQSAVTPALASFRQKPEITVNGGKAEIHFIISGPLTHIQVENCVKGTEICVTENIVISEKERRKRQTSELIHDFIGEVKLADPEAKVIVFSFWIYDGDIALYSDPVTEEVNTSKVSYPLIIGVLLVALVVVMTIVAVVMLWRRGLLKKHVFLCKRSKKRKSERTNNISNQKSSNSVNTEEEHYEMPTSPVIKHRQPSDVYEGLLEADVNIFKSSNITMKYLVCDGDFYQTWQGRLSDKINPPLQVVIKKTKGDTDVYIQYLQTQGLYLTKMRSSDHIVTCLGMTPDWKFLIMEEASLGNLKQYLETRATETYYNVTSSQSFEMSCIHQINESIQAVHQLSSPALFYCLSASNVLLSGDKKCKLSGFSSAEVVRAREKWEEDNKLTRPVQWLSPETITLNHVTQSDVWSFGILMWEIFSGGKLPFGDISDNQARQKILSGQKPTKPLKCSDEVYDIMTLCWMRQPCNRLSLQDISLRCIDITQYEEV